MTTDTKAVALYPEVCPMQLDKDGGYYCRHVEAMTAEGLHRKSDIAEQLGWRDREIDKLRTALAASRAEVEGLRAACSGSAYTLFLDAYYKACETSKPSDWHDAAMLAKQWEQQIDAAMEKGNV
ncbi:hypothetical protein [Stenotrophomonas sp. BIGb0135]|uniref:hypothetical protein n=1 Tax=Stenotrophomonas sp. BIGb0135 TaxID=2940620 RepID=UPI002166CF79|nr:hypothetical protein [Stenotrophomonas sp. BIGb0135]MCS4234464.1 hypothetical protein [Stenotrophomonas sp. BIGb0135]